MRLLVDNALSPALAAELAAGGFDAVHLRDYGMQAASDAVVFDRALAENRVLISADTDFGTLLATRHTDRPSLVLLRGMQERHPDRQADLLGRLLARYESELEAGIVLVVEESRVRIRQLPFR